MFWSGFFNKDKGMKEVKDRYGRTLLNTLDRFVDSAREASSRGAAFLYAVIGVIAQVAHNSLLAYEVSLFQNEYLRIVQAIVVAMTISFALIYFVLTADGKEYSKSTKTVYTFYTLEVFLNLVYYFKKIVFDDIHSQVMSSSWQEINWFSPNWFLLLIGIPLAVFIPFIIKSYAGAIQAHKPALALDEEDFVKTSDIERRVSEKVNEILESFKKENAFQQETDIKDIVKALLSEPRSEDTELTELKNEIVEMKSALEDLQTNETAEVDTAAVDEKIQGLQVLIENFENSSSVLQSKLEHTALEKIQKIMSIESELSEKVDKLSENETRSMSKDDIESLIRRELRTSKSAVSSETLNVLKDELTSIKKELHNRNEVIENLKNEIGKTIKSGTTIKLKSGEKQSEFMIV